MAAKTDGQPPVSRSMSLNVVNENVVNLAEARFECTFGRGAKGFAAKTADHPSGLK